MNSTILALHISSNSLSPIFSYTSTYQNTNLKFSQIHASKLFSNFIYSNHQMNAHIYKSKFTNSLNTAIRVNEVSIINATRYNRLSADGITAFSIIDCLFYRLKTLNQEGGAVSIDCGNGSIILKNTGFFKCSSDKACGAASLRARNIVSIGNCFHNCSSGGDYASIKARGDSALNKGQMMDANFTSFFNCPFSKLYGRDYTAAFQYFTLNYIECNSSFNYLAGVYAYPYLQLLKYNSIKFSNVASCQVDTLITFAKISDNSLSSISHFNVFNNTVGGKVLYIQIKCILSNFVFVDNTYKDGLHMGLATDCYVIFTNSFFDGIPNFTLPASFSQNLNATYINSTNSTARHAYPTLNCEFIQTYQCWGNDVNTDSGVVAFYLQWKRTLIVLAILIGVVFLGVFGKRLFEYGMRKRAERKEPTDTESIIQPNSSAFNGQYNFDMY
ncbi:hypothetical protein TVAG_367430 [Trichomonas vaginalis G3]|uniref:Transmembrane protein n=1 Tax=Trichomonas vaginalis (strain ATCC PRA-98 / G3) TaxID=412133 RepID=A2F5Q1_TRIV3|nr:hypothetical protein TVAGG3_0977330 [Trichomonas vaginalis G3]EAX99751.1 hypothetical protein TVAG_367430 [Trichomonas vaginalis G3]KAI5489035.1 hypothetical protein TVAGG3_0977330 [Trichomonas vaginalis G3]|eukprot:XP_001312681.1 hypothetical protein [Trichomonas vaginalis G3]